MINLGNALAESGKASSAPKHDFKVGDSVEITNRDFDGEKATVEKLTENMFGAPLIDVKLESGNVTCFYPHELKHV